MFNVNPENFTWKSNTHPCIHKFSYYEFKYLVPHSKFLYVKEVLDEQLGQSDPFPAGIVDSIYYDTYNEILLEQCLDGDAEKSKFRIRGYGDGFYTQMHQKNKILSGVKKNKSSIKPVSAPMKEAPVWSDLQAVVENDDFRKIYSNSLNVGLLHPSIRVKYFRFRYRTNDYRITLDTNIEVYSLGNGLPRKMAYSVLPDHVLEVKTLHERPQLPFVGLIKLEQVSFSKFMLGLKLLNTF